MNDVKPKHLWFFIGFIVAILLIKFNFESIYQFIDETLISKL